jgi:hypothetical protein
MAEGAPGLRGPELVMAIIVFILLGLAAVELHRELFNSTGRSVW